MDLASAIHSTWAGRSAASAHTDSTGAAMNTDWVMCATDRSLVRAGLKR